MSENSQIYSLCFINENNFLVSVPPRAKSNRGEENVVVLKGDVARLKCPVKADPRPTFTWTKDGQPLLIDSHR